MVYYHMEIIRHNEIETLKKRLKANPVVAILGPRQCGKTTLANQFARQKTYKNLYFFDCEDPADLNRLENPMLTLEPMNGLIIIDEIQRKPDIFPILRVIIDKYPKKRFLILGSASRELVFKSSETLAGPSGGVRIVLRYAPFPLRHSIETRPARQNNLPVPNGRSRDRWVRAG